MAEIAAAQAPYQPRRRTAGLFLSHYWGMVRVMLADYRQTWQIQLFFGLLMPLGMVFFLRYMGGPIDRDRAIFLVGGNITTAITYGPVVLITSKVGWGRHTHDFDYWAALPLPKLAVLLSLVTVSLLMGLPSLISVYLLGSWMLGLPLQGGPALIPLVPLGTLSLACLGAFMGTYAKDGQTANMLANALMGFVTFLSPTMVPLASLPAPLRYVAHFVPTTYAADAFRAALAGQFGTALLLDVGILAAFTVAFLYLVYRKLDWRGS